MAWTTPRTWTDTEVVTAAMMNTHVRDNLSALDPVFYDFTMVSDTASFDTLVTIPSTHRSLRIVADLRSTTGCTGLANAQLRFNSDSSAIYDTDYAVGGGTSSGYGEALNGTSAFIGNTLFDGGPAGYFSSHVIDVPYYVSGTHKNWSLQAVVFSTQSAGGAQTFVMQGNWRSTSVISRVQIFLSSGNIKAGSRLRVYGTF